MPADGDGRQRETGRARPSPIADAFASPKSSTFTTPSGVTLMLAGFRSRWMMPFSCAASSASAICRAMASASVGGDRARARVDPRASRPRLARAPARERRRLFQAVDRADVRMIERRQHPRLALETREPLGIAA